MRLVAVLCRFSSVCLLYLLIIARQIVHQHYASMFVRVKCWQNEEGNKEKLAQRGSECIWTRSPQSRARCATAAGTRACDTAGASGAWAGCGRSGSAPWPCGWRTWPACTPPSASACRRHTAWSSWPSHLWSILRKKNIYSFNFDLYWLLIKYIF